MNKFLKNSYQLLIYGLLYLPIVVVIAYSFNNSKRSLLWHGFTWHWYHDLFHDTDLLMVAWHSLSIGLLAATIAAILGSIIATAFYKYRFAGKQTLFSLVFTLIVIPDIMLAVALLLMYNLLHIPFGFWSLLLAHISFCIPFVIVIVNNRLKSLDKHLIEAAKDLGATDFQIFRKILLPLLMPAMLSGWLISFTLSLDDVIISFFVSGPSYEILPLRIFSQARMGVSPELNALCSVMLIVTVFAVLVAQLMLGRKKSV